MVGASLAPSARLSWPSIPFACQFGLIDRQVLAKCCDLVAHSGSELDLFFFFKLSTMIPLRVAMPKLIAPAPGGLGRDTAGDQAGTMCPAENRAAVGRVRHDSYG